MRKVLDFPRLSPLPERWLSGLKRTPGKREWAYTPPGVRIPLSPPVSCPRLDSTRLPAVENRGEGVFLLFDASAILAWLQRAVVQTRSSRLARGFDAWKDTHPNSSREFPGVPYYLLHTFSHLLMTAISLDCGYPASSLRERIYAFPAEGSLPDRFGILVFTASSDAEGTLGGLGEAARRIKGFVRTALEMASLCSNDPICAHHQPGEHDHAPPLAEQVAAYFEGLRQSGHLKRLPDGNPA